MSRFSQRWRTQRNAIRNANCRISESSNFWTQIALPGTPGSIPVSVSVDTTRKSYVFVKYVIQCGIWFLLFSRQYGLKCIDLYPHINGYGIDELGGPWFRNSNVHFSVMILVSAYFWKSDGFNNETFVC